ncbi:MAG TPA: hypothetical protein VF811_08675 [Parasulfuritortus sp.]
MINMIKRGDRPTDFKVKAVLNVNRPHPINQTGGKVVACDLDDACVQLDCEPFSQEIEQVLVSSREGHDYVMHYCGIDFLQKAGDTERQKK